MIAPTSDTPVAVTKTAELVALEKIVDICCRWESIGSPAIYEIRQVAVSALERAAGHRDESANRTAFSGG